MVEIYFYKYHVYSGGKFLLLKGKGFHMSFKSWSSSQSAAGKNKADSKPKAVPSVSAEGAQPSQMPAKVLPTAKSSTVQPRDQVAKASHAKKP